MLFFKKHIVILCACLFLFSNTVHAMEQGSHRSDQGSIIFRLLVAIPLIGRLLLRHNILETPLNGIANERTLTPVAAPPPALNATVEASPISSGVALETSPTASDVALETFPAARGVIAEASPIASGVALETFPAAPGVALETFPTAPGVALETFPGAPGVALETFPTASDVALEPFPAAPVTIDDGSALLRVLEEDDGSALLAALEEDDGSALLAVPQEKEATVEEATVEERNADHHRRRSRRSSGGSSSGRLKGSSSGRLKGSSSSNLLKGSSSGGLTWASTSMESFGAIEDQEGDETAWLSESALERSLVELDTLFRDMRTKSSSDSLRILNSIMLMLTSVETGGLSHQERLELLHEIEQDAGKISAYIESLGKRDTQSRLDLQRQYIKFSGLLELEKESTQTRATRQRAELEAARQSAADKFRAAKEARIEELRQQERLAREAALEAAFKEAEPAKREARRQEKIRKQESARRIKAAKGVPEELLEYARAENFVILSWTHGGMRTDVRDVSHKQIRELLSRGHTARRPERDQISDSDPNTIQFAFFGEVEGRELMVSVVIEKGALTVATAFWKEK